MPEIRYQYDDYAQSANALFHFVTKDTHLKDILRERALFPRYCVEDIGYLGLQGSGVMFQRIAVLQKCFCDIPFHKLMDTSEIHIADGYGEQLSEDERVEVLSKTTHPDLYGRYAIAFSKEWGERHGLQPVQYVNNDSELIRNFSALFTQMVESDDLPAQYAADILDRLCYMKPLRGTMDRTVISKDGDRKTVKIQKNFHDEREWRYVPDAEALEQAQLSSVIANTVLMEQDDSIRELSSNLTTELYQGIWLRYDYSDVRYIIVPDPWARLEIIDTVMSLPDGAFDGEDAQKQRYVLLSKILVLDELRKDW